MSSKSAISRSAHISIFLFVLAGGLLIGFAASNQLSSPLSQTIYETLVTTDTQSQVVESPVPTTITESTTFIATATVTTIQTKTTTNSSAIQALEQELSSLRNVSSQLQLELSVMDQAGKLSLSVFAVNQTITVLGNTTSLFYDSGQRP
ncbi:MAG TPA: hypothetical protein VFF30_03350 [Nitrososphaerales archaeon]|nr:hypothetical protein [Nitrososphaerales archaeon]